MTLFLLVRHGENAWVNKHRLAGWLPGVHLNKNGHRQAKEASLRLSSVPVEALYSSPLTRCVETAEYFAAQYKLPIIYHQEFGEVRYGDWEGKKVKQLAKKPQWRTVQFFPSRMRFPGGEALREVQFRAVQALERLSESHQGQTVMVVSHADLLKLLLAHYLGTHIDLFQRIVISPASVSMLHLSEQGFVRVLRVNDDGPFEALKKPGKDKPGKKK
ncbi:MAG: MSMEG_4193 family putative phosphomutase [Candidatus Promineifilaceae bacterium]|jgi:probable phosphomutase (TIGR03848 family)